MVAFVILQISRKRAFKADTVQFVTVKIFKGENSDKNENQFSYWNINVLAYNTMTMRYLYCGRPTSCCCDVYHLDGARGHFCLC